MQRFVPLFLPLLAFTGCDDSEAAGGGELAGSRDGGAKAAAVLRFSAIPDKNTSELKAKFGPVADYLTEVLGVTVAYVPVADYGASVEAFVNGDIHVAWFGGLTGLQARKAVPGARAIVQGAEDPKFYSYLIANQDTGLERSDAFPEGLARYQFTFGSEKSTSGRLMPEFFIRESTGKAPREFFEKEPLFSGSHDKTCEYVASGRAQIGAVNYQVYHEMVDAGKIDPAEVKIIWKTPFYADYNITAHPELETIFGTGFITKLQSALIALDDPKLLKAFGRSAMIAAENADFDALRAVAIDLDMLR